jgi:hypothetical protein
MPAASLTTDVRRLVMETFSQLGLSDGAEPRESVLIRGGAYCGRRFDVEHGHAIWFLEPQQVKFFRASGALVHSIEPIGCAPSRLRLAA